MASLQQRGESYSCIFCYHGKRQWLTLGKVTRAEAEAKAAQIDYLLLRLKQKLAVLPPGVDIVAYVQHDGQPPQTEAAGPARKPPTLALLRDRYLETHEASLEKTTVDGIRLHFKHLTATLGENYPIGELSLEALQKHVDRRAKAKGTNGRRLSSATIKKEIVSLRTAWNWGVKMKLVAGRFPYDGLRYPKTHEKPPFQTREEIERRIAAGGVTAAEQADLWNSLYLQVDEIAEFLDHVKARANHSFIYPMVCMAAHTGARRSELLRIRVADVDLAGNTVLIHEKKRAKGRGTTRRVPLSPFLVGVLKSWLAEHRGGAMLFCQERQVGRSRKRSPTTGHKGDRTRATSRKAREQAVISRPAGQAPPLTPDEAHDHFKRTLQGSKWAVLRGWHVCRHSFISALASKGVDQRLIDDFVGHQSEEQRRRYRHLYPSVKEQAIAAVFGGPGR